MLTHPDFSLATRIAYMPSGLCPSLIKIEDESVEYGALTFTLDNKMITFRTGKITPTKPGFFVTLWQRINGLTKPHHIKDSSNFFVISVHDNIGFGQFIFHKSLLLQHRVISSESKEGKRGIRLYPPWIQNLNKQAKRSQDWQCKHFIQFDSSSHVKYIALINAFKNH